MSADLPVTARHRGVLNAAAGSSGWTIREPVRRQTLLTALGSAEVAVAYVMSKANGGPGGPLPPELLFVDDGATSAAARPISTVLSAMSTGPVGRSSS